MCRRGSSTARIRINHPTSVCDSVYGHDDRTACELRGAAAVSRRGHGASFEYQRAFAENRRENVTVGSQSKQVMRSCMSGPTAGSDSDGQRFETISERDR